MGKSDPYVFTWYAKNLPSDAQKIAILGSTSESFVREAFPNAQIDLFDIQLKNWDINDPNWKIELNYYDLVVCTRCAYFSRDPRDLIDRCLTLIKTGGCVFIDWGYGDHWRFEKFKVGWLKDGEHEYASYKGHTSHLYSGIWNPNWENDSAVLEFKKNIQKFDYNETLSEILNQEVPYLHLIDDVDVKFLSLWPDRPQLYLLIKIYK